jgi:hypothetical protein
MGFKQRTESIAPSANTYWLLDTEGDITNEDLLFVDDVAGQLGSAAVALASGDSRTLPKRPTLQCAEDYGSGLGSIVGNTQGYLICHRDIAKIVEDAGHEQLQCIDVSLVAHGREISGYVILNPLGVFDCAESMVVNSRNRLVQLRKFSLSGAKLVGCPPLFRLAGAPSEFVLTGSLVDALKAAGCTNLFTTAINVV